LIRSVANAAAAAGVTPDRAISGARAEQRAAVTPDRAISGARAEQRAACAAQASESESSSLVQ